jgi:hypothetical protein
VGEIRPGCAANAGEGTPEVPAARAVRHGHVHRPDDVRKAGPEGAALDGAYRAARDRADLREGAAENHRSADLRDRADVAVDGVHSGVSRTFPHRAGPVVRVGRGDGRLDGDQQARQQGDHARDSARDHHVRTSCIGDTHGRRSGIRGQTEVFSPGWSL